MVTGSWSFGAPTTRGLPDRRPVRCSDFRIFHFRCGDHIRRGRADCGGSRRPTTSTGWRTSPSTDSRSPIATSTVSGRWRPGRTSTPKFPEAPRWPAPDGHCLFACSPGSPLGECESRRSCCTPESRAKRRPSRRRRSGTWSPRRPQRWSGPPASPAGAASAAAPPRPAGGRVVAVGTTATRALETVADADGSVHAGQGWTDLVLSANRPARVVDGLLTGLHEPGASHLELLRAVAGEALVARAYDAATRGPHLYLWHEFGDSMLFLP